MSASSSRPRRKFTDEFKDEAVRLVAVNDGNVAKTAKELGIYDSTLSNWVKRAGELARGGPTVEERAVRARVLSRLALT